MAGRLRLEQPCPFPNTALQPVPPCSMTASTIAAPCLLVEHLPHVLCIADTSTLFAVFLTFLRAISLVLSGDRHRVADRFHYPIKRPLSICHPKFRRQPHAQDHIPNTLPLQRAHYLSSIVVRVESSRPSRRQCGPSLFSTLSPRPSRYLFYSAPFPRTIFE